MTDQGGANRSPGSPLVSVIVPFLDAERFLVEALESVFAQTLTDWELILVDDGSRDGSHAIAEQFARRRPERVRILRHPDNVNRGISASRNLGMGSARGRYIAFLDADDVYLPDRLRRHVEALERDPQLEVVISAEQYWYSWQPLGPESRRDHVVTASVDAGQRIAPPALIVATLCTPGAVMPCPGSITFRHTVFQQVGGAPDEFRLHYEDQVLICKLLLDFPALVLHVPLVRYRQHAASVTQANAPMERVRGSAAHAGRERFLDWLDTYVATRRPELSELRRRIDELRTDLRRDAASTMFAAATAASHGSRLHRAARRVLPPRLVAALASLKAQGEERLIRRRVMRRIADIELARGTPRDADIRAYWNARIHDTKLSDDAPGTAAFFAALDRYRLRKCAYLPRLVHFDAWANRDVLEIGCGAGLDLVRFARGGARVTGVDIARSAIDLARDYCRVTGVAATLREADGADLPFADASFDLVYCHGVLSFARDPAAIIREAQRVLRPGGEAILMVYHRRSLMNLLIRMPASPVGRGHADAPGFQSFSRAEFAAMLAGFGQARIVMERNPGSRLPAFLQAPLRPFGWHMLAFCLQANSANLHVTVRDNQKAVSS